MFWLTGVFPSNGQTISPTFPQSALVFYTVETVVLCLTESWIISPFPSHWIKEICDRVFHSLYQHSQLLSFSVNCNKDLQPSLASDLMTCHDLIRNIVPDLAFDVVTCHDLIIKNSPLPIPSPKEKGGRGCRVHAWSQHLMTQRPETDTVVISLMDQWTQHKGECMKWTSEIWEDADEQDRPFKRTRLISCTMLINGSPKEMQNKKTSSCPRRGPWTPSTRSSTMPCMCVCVCVCVGGGEHPGQWAHVLGGHPGHWAQDHLHDLGGWGGGHPWHWAQDHLHVLGGHPGHWAQNHLHVLGGGGGGGGGGTLDTGFKTVFMSWGRTSVCTAVTA